MLKKFFPLRLNKYCQKLQKRFFFCLQDDCELPWWACFPFLWLLSYSLMDEHQHWIFHGILVFLVTYFFFLRIITFLGGQLLHKNVIFE